MSDQNPTPLTPEQRRALVMKPFPIVTRYPRAIWAGVHIADASELKDQMQKYEDIEV